MTTATTLDFGNGYVAGFTSRDEIRVYDHEGLEAPTLELFVSPNSTDGAVIGGTRAEQRRMTVWAEFEDGSTRQDIMRAFTPGVLRYLSTARGSIPYYVEVPPEFSTSNLRGVPDAKIVMLSEYAYPRGEPQALGEEAAYQFTEVKHDTGTYALPPFAGNNVYAIWQSFTVPTGGGYVSMPGFWFDTPYTGRFLQIAITPTSGGLPVYSSVTWTNTDAPIGGAWAKMPGAPVWLAAGVYAITALFSTNLMSPRRDTSAGFANGVGGHAVYVGGVLTPIVGDGTDTTIDWRFCVTISTLAATTTSIVFDGATEVPAPGIFTITPATSELSCVVSDGVNTTTIEGSIAAGSVVVVNSLEHTVTVNGTDRLSWFDKAGAWPMVNPGASTLSVWPASTVAVTWRSRLMGLL